MESGAEASNAQAQQIQQLLGHVEQLQEKLAAGHEEKTSILQAAHEKAARLSQLEGEL